MRSSFILLTVFVVFDSKNTLILNFYYFTLVMYFYFYFFFVIKLCIRCIPYIHIHTYIILLNYYLHYLCFTFVMYLKLFVIQSLNFFKIKHIIAHFHPDPFRKRMLARARHCSIGNHLKWASTRVNVLGSTYTWNYSIKHSCENSIKRFVYHVCTILVENMIWHDRYICSPIYSDPQITSFCLYMYVS